MEFDFSVDESTPPKARYSQRDEELFVLRDMPAYALRPASQYPLETYMLGYVRASRLRRKFNWPNARPEILRDLANWVLNNPPKLRITKGKWIIEYKVIPPFQDGASFLLPNAFTEEPAMA